MTGFRGGCAGRRLEGRPVLHACLDWYHDDYPHYGDKQHPMRNRPEYGNEGRNFDRYLDYMHNQIREICTNYGRLDVLWFDFSYEDKYNVMRGEAWRATESNQYGAGAPAAGDH